jgi:hypothetical protein
MTDTKFTPEFIAKQREEMACPFSTYRLQAALANYCAALDEIERLHREGCLPCDDPNFDPKTVCNTCNKKKVCPFRTGFMFNSLFCSGAQS